MITLAILFCTILLEMMHKKASSIETKARVINGGMLLYGSLIFIAPLYEVLEPMGVKELILKWLMNSLYYAIVILLVRTIVCLRE